MKREHLAILVFVIGVLAGMYFKWVFTTEQFACEFDDFYGIAMCYRVLGECEKDSPEDPTYLKLSTPYSTYPLYGITENGEHGLYSKETCMKAGRFYLTEGYVALPNIEQ